MSTAAQIMVSHEQKRARMALRRTLDIRRAERHTDINPSVRSVSVEAAPEWSRLLGVPVAPGTPTAALPHGHELDEVKALTPSQRSGYLKLRAAGGTHERALADAKTLPGGGGSREGRDLGDVASRIESAAKAARPAKKTAPRKAPAKKAGALAGLPPLVPRTEWSGWTAEQHETYARDRMRALSDPEVSARVSPALRQSVEKDARQHFAIAATMRKKAETPAPAKKAGRETPLQQATAEARQARQAREAEAKAARVRGAEDQLRQSHAKPPAKKAAPPRKGTPERDALDKAMVRDYTRGASLSEVAEKHGVSAAFVHESLTTQGVQLRGRGAPRAKRAPSRRAGITPHEFEVRHDAGTRAGLSDAEAAKYARSDFDSPKAWREAHPAKGPSAIQQARAAEGERRAGRQAEASKAGMSAAEAQRYAKSDMSLEEWRRSHPAKATPAKATPPKLVAGQKHARSLKAGERITLSADLKSARSTGSHWQPGETVEVRDVTPDRGDVIVHWSTGTRDGAFKLPAGTAFDVEARPTKATPRPAKATSSAATTPPGVPSIEHTPERVTAMKRLGVDPTMVDSRDIKPGETFYLQTRLGRYNAGVGHAIVAGEYMPGTTMPRFVGDDGETHVLTPGVTVYRPAKPARPAKAAGATPRQRVVTETARRLREEAGTESDAIRILAADQDLSSAQLRRVAAEMGIEVPDDMRAKTSLQLHIAQAVARERGLPSTASLVAAGATPAGAREATGAAARPETPRMRALREGLSPTEANSYVKWLKDHPNGSVSAWRQARREGGGGRLTESERAALSKNLVRQYVTGKSIQEIADATGRSYGFVHRMLTEAGVQLRQRGASRPRRS